MSAIILYGRPGSGKSTLAASMTNLGYKPHFIDMDCKVKGMKNLEERLKDKQITYEECPEPLDQGKLKARVLAGLKYYPKVQPRGYLWLVDCITELEEEPLKDAHLVVPVIDTMTSVNRHMKRLVRYFKKDMKLDFTGWDCVLQNYEELFMAFTNLQPDPYPHVIITVHAKDDKDKVLESIETRPLLDGQFKDAVGDFVEEMYFLEVEAVGRMSKAKFWAITKPVGRITQARTSRDLPTRVDADFGIIFKGEEVK